MVCAHELGHALLHPTLNTSYLTEETYFSKDKIERQANEFAAHLLLPDDFYKDPEFEGMGVDQVAEMVGVPVGLVKITSNQL